MNNCFKPPQPMYPKPTIAVQKRTRCGTRHERVVQILCTVFTDGHSVKPKDDQVDSADFEQPDKAVNTRGQTPKVYDLSYLLCITLLDRWSQVCANTSRAEYYTSSIHV